MASLDGSETLPRPAQLSVRRSKRVHITWSRSTGCLPVDLDQVICTLFDRLTLSCAGRGSVSDPSSEAITAGASQLPATTALSWSNLHIVTTDRLDLPHNHSILPFRRPGRHHSVLVEYGPTARQGTPLGATRSSRWEDLVAPRGVPWRAVGPYSTSTEWWRPGRRNGRMEWLWGRSKRSVVTI